MFESAEIGHRIAKSVYRREEPVLRAALLAAQHELLARKSQAVVVLVNGVDGAGKGETVNLLNEWMDPRHIRTEAFGPLRDDERTRPEMWRFWRVLPGHGHVGILFGSWYTDPILAHVMGHEKKARFATRLERIREFERMLSAEGVVLVKLWFHMSRAAARKRFKQLEADPLQAWRVTPADWERLKHHDEFVKVCEQALRKTNTANAPWMIIEGADPAYRSLTAGRLVLDALSRATSDAGSTPAGPAAQVDPQGSADGRTLLGSFDYSQRLTASRYEKALGKAQARLNALSRHPGMADRSLVVVFEGMDAAGKGSTIRRVTQALDARFYRVVPIAAPTDEERAQPYLWRFWRHVPPHGHAILFDRSWYGRVLVERVEGFCAPADWMRAFDEINSFEEQLTDAGALVVKFWLAITPDEQLRRFKARQETPHKQFKITPEDWRNRERWPRYELAVADMVDRTSTGIAPWHVVACDDKLFARIEVLDHLCDRLEAALGNSPARRRGKDGGRRLRSG